MAQSLSTGRDLVIAVSRRFKLPEIEALYAGTIEPELRRWGIVLRCDYASDAMVDVDFWINRMNVILDVADVHVFVDIYRSGNTFYEFQYSSLCSLLGAGTSLVWNFGLHPPVHERPCQIFIYRDNDDVIRVSLERFFGLAHPRSAQTDRPLEHGLSEALHLVSATVRDARWESAPQNAGAPPVSARSRTQYWRIKATIAHELEQGFGLSDILSSLHHAEVADRSARWNRLLGSREEVATHKVDVTAYCKDLRELAILWSNAFAERPRFRDVYAYTRRYLEALYIGWMLRSNPDYSAAAADLGKLRPYVMMFSLLAAAGVLKTPTLRPELRRAGLPIGAVIDHSLTSIRDDAARRKSLLLRASLTLCWLCAVLVVVALVDRHLILLPIVRAYFWAGASLVMYNVVVSLWINRQSARKRPVRRWPNSAYVLAAALGELWWLAYFGIPSWITPLVHGSMRTARAAVGVFAITISIGVAATLFLLWRVRRDRSEAELATHREAVNQVAAWLKYFR